MLILHLNNLLGIRVAVDQVTIRANYFVLQELLQGHHKGQSGGALTLYKLTITGPTYLWHKRSSRVFMNKCVRDISEILFKEW